MEPTFDQVRRAVKTALYSRDPFIRAEAAAKLELWGLPATPAALPMVARQIASENEIPLTLDDMDPPFCRSSGDEHQIPDNRYENLELLSKSEHGRLSNERRKGNV
jgi:hypothetical protein